MPITPAEKPHNPGADGGASRRNISRIGDRFPMHLNFQLLCRQSSWRIYKRSQVGIPEAVGVFNQPRIAFPYPQDSPCQEIARIILSLVSRPFNYSMTGSSSQAPATSVGSSDLSDRHAVPSIHHCLWANQAYSDDGDDEQVAVSGMAIETTENFLAQLSAHCF